MRTLLLGLICGALVYAAADPIAAVREGLKQLAVDSSETYRVRELEISKGGVKFYLSEGVLAFATPVNGQRIAAVYTTSPVEAGDAEVISFPPTAAERASLARFTKSPNMDEHFTSALLFFADSTAADLVRQIHEHPLHPAPELAADIGTTFNDSLRRSAAEIEVRVTQSILDHHIPANSFFYGMVTGRTLGSVDFVFQPEQPDKMIFGRVAKRESGGSYFQIWSAFRPAHTPEEPEPYHLSDYHIDTTIHADLSMTAAADFDYLADADDGAVISLFITQRLRATAATVDGKVAALMMHDSPRTTDEKGAVEFLISTGEPLTPGSHHRVHIDYGGSVIRRTANGAYFVDDRNAWYPLVMPMLTVFDLTFHCPENLRLVATGDPVSEVVQNGQRTVRRRTAQAQALAGFNLGEFKIATSERANYRIDICSNAQATVTPDLADQTGRILEYFTNRWMPLSGRTIAITPIEGYFGQGFPGLIYLSSMSYLKQKDRPEALRNTMLDSFFFAIVTAA